MPVILGVDEETDNLQKLMKGHGLSVQRLSGNDATVENAKKEMSSFHWVHLACHATQEPLRPLTSAFHLLDGQLSLSDIIKLKVPDADLAFLSACETSTGDKQLSDEAVHLAAGMLAAGYRSVVSTMWSIRDSNAIDVAESFYSDLINRAKKGGKAWPDSTGAAHAIHHATQCLRKRFGDKNNRSLLRWVPYVHFGL
jgi:CHAT domain-containing protein